MKPASHVRATVSGDGVVFMDVANGVIFAANAVGARIWQELSNGTAEADIARDISRQFAVDLPIVESDVREFIDALRARGILQ